MPTLPMTAPALRPADAPREFYIQRAFEMIANTAQFDANGHPTERSRHQRDLHLFAPHAPGA